MPLGVAGAATAHSGGFGVGFIFGSDEDVGQHPVSLTPSGKDFISSHIGAHDIANRREQGFGDIGVVFSLYPAIDMALDHAADCGAEVLKLVDVFGIGENRIGEAARLFA